MDRINKLFSNKKHDILSIYFCAGAPKANNTAEVITSLEKNGVDMIEIGIPFSDPLADGPGTTQRHDTDRTVRTTERHPQHSEHTSHPYGLSQSDNAIWNGTVLQELQQHRHRRGNHPRPAFR